MIAPIDERNTGEYAALASLTAIGSVRPSTLCEEFIMSRRITHPLLPDALASEGSLTLRRDFAIADRLVRGAGAASRSTLLILAALTACADNGPSSPVARAVVLRGASASVTFRE